METKKRRGNPNWVKGMKSPNPHGRARGAAGLAKYVKSQTKNGFEMVDKLLEIMRMPVKNNRDKRECMNAASILLDRGFGKAPTTELGTAVDLDTGMEGASDEQIEAIITAAEAAGLKPN